MQSLPCSPVDLEVKRIRDLSKGGQHGKALAAAEALATVAPENRDALYLIAANQRCLRRIPDALATLERLEEQYPGFSLLYQERGHCYLTLRDVTRAIDAFSRAVTLNPALTTSWTLLEALYRNIGETKGAAAAAGQLSTLKGLPTEILRAGSLFSDGDLDAAEEILRGYLQKADQHVEALRLLARIQHRRGVFEEAESLLETVLKLAPDYRAANVDSVLVLLDRQKYFEAREAIQTQLRLEPGNREYLSMYAAACAGLGQYEQAIEAYRQMLAGQAASAEAYVALGHCLKSLGRQEEAIESYQAGLRIRPSFGDAYWSLANLKIYRFSEGEIASMRAEENAPATTRVDRYHLCFALGKAHEDRDEYAESWRFYERGNRLKRAEGQYDAEATEAEIRSQIEVCTPEFFAQRAGTGVTDPDPIFIVGLPRSGSTLLEQILASHSLIEGTQELPEIQRIASKSIGAQRNLADVPVSDFRALGEGYMEAARPYRGSRPFFVDKMPNNFRHIGLIHLMLPNAKIIDVRREPMACCFSNLKQLFANGQEFSYSIDGIARYYRMYLDVMRHWDEVLPGRVLRVSYEDVVADLEGNVRRITDFCGLEFEPACIEFYKTERSIGTPSSEQVRKPIFGDGLHQWRNFAPWLGPLKSELGDALVRYRE